MSRLTRYDEKQKQYIRLASRLAVDNKLGKLEDLEEEIDFDLTKLQNANHIYTYDCENKFKKYEIIGINFVEKKIYFWDSFCPMYLDLADYKNYWWLKEDKSE